MKIDRNKKKHIGILHKALQEQRLSRQEILLLLKSRPGLETDLLFKTARQLRENILTIRFFFTDLFITVPIAEIIADFATIEKIIPFPSGTANQRHKFWTFPVSLQNQGFTSLILPWESLFH